MLKMVAMPTMSFLATIVVFKFLESPTIIYALIILTTNLIMLMVIEILTVILTCILIGTQRSTLIGIMLITHGTKLMVR